jgi:hypothetical protein
MLHCKIGLPILQAYNTLIIKIVELNEGLQPGHPSNFFTTQVIG